MAYPKLFSAGIIGKLSVKNRLVMPPMVRNYADTNGFVTDRYVAHIQNIAKGGVGTIILEASFISPEGKGFVNELGIHSDKVIPGLKRLVDVAHEYGAVIGPQLYHAGRQTSSKTTGKQPLAPSPVADPTINEVPRELDHKEINRLVKAYGEAGTRAKEAGCDFVEIHGAHGYLITQFLSSFSNQRQDEYGGSLDERMKFMLDVYESVRLAVGKDFPIIVRLSGEEMVDGGLTIEDTKIIAKRLEEVGANALHISVGNYASYSQGRMIPPMAVPDAPLLHLAEAVKKVVKIPVIAVGKIRFPEMAENIIKQGKADFVAIGRTLLADPNWPNKVKNNKLEEINHCISCNEGCISRLFAQKDVWCTTNPQTGRELEFAVAPKKRRKIVVVGGGPAGLSAAKTAAERGHEVILYEKTDKLGGQLFLAEVAPHRQGWKELREYLTCAVKKMDITIHLKTNFTKELVVKEKPDVVIVAIGSIEKIPNIIGIDGKNVVTNRAILSGHATAGKSVVVLGGGCAGAQTAEFLAENGHDVTIVEVLQDIAMGAPIDDRALFLERLKKLNVKMFTRSKVLEIRDNGVLIQEGEAKGREIIVDTVVICLGSVSNNHLADELKGILNEVVLVGDAKQPQQVTEAMAEGALAVLKF